MQLFCLQLEASCLQWSFFTYNHVWELVFFVEAFYSFSFFTYSFSFCAYSGKLGLISTLTDRKQRSSTARTLLETRKRKKTNLQGIRFFLCNRKTIFGGSQKGGFQ